jgi:putative nucleotidyltransferase with HDIG domain
MSAVTYQQDLRGLVESIDDLPGFPAAIQKASALSQDPKASAADLAAVIQVDPALTTRILRITNSAFYGLSRQVSTVKEGVVILGFAAVRSLAVAVSSMRMFHGGDSVWFRHEDFWLHSTCCALVAHQLSQSARLPSADEAFTAGLLHDIGKIILDQYAHQTFMLLIATQKVEGQLDPETERRIICTDHAELGRGICERWKLPPALSGSVGGHHSTGSQRGGALATVVGLADYLCACNGVPSVVGAGPPPKPAGTAIQKLPPAALHDVHKRFPEIRREASKLIEVV